MNPKYYKFIVAIVIAPLLINIILIGNKFNLSKIAYIMI